MGGRAGRQYTFFMFSARTSYSSKTSCSRGESSGGSESVFIVDSIADGPAPSLVFSYAVGGRGGSVEGSDASRLNDPAIFEHRAGLDWEEVPAGCPTGLQYEQSLARSTSRYDFVETRECRQPRTVIHPQAGPQVGTFPASSPSHQHTLPSISGCLDASRKRAMGPPCDG